MPESCAGIDTGNGYDCYGLPVGDTVDPFLSDTQKAALWARLTNGDPMTLTEQVAIRNGLFGQPGVTWLNRRTGGVQALPVVNVTTTAVPVVAVLLLILALTRRS